MIRYAFCLLLLAAFGAHASHFRTTVDSNGIVGLYSSLRLTSRGPVVSYYDATNGDLKLATCTADCDRDTATWVVTTVDSAGDVGLYPSMAIANDNQPVIAYYDATNRKLKMAVCTGGCTTIAPSWIITTVDPSSADVGRSPSLRFNSSGNIVIAYRDSTNTDVKLATCIAACATASPQWVITMVDGPGDMGRALSLFIGNDSSDTPVIAYLDSSNGALKLATCTAACTTASPTWVKTVIDRIPGDVEMKVGLDVNFNNPTVSYYDAASGHLKVATCFSGCRGASPTWRIDVPDPVGDSGQWSTLWLDGGRPGVAYFGSVRSCNSGGGATVCHAVSDLRYALCDSNCERPLWGVATLDSDGPTGVDPSQQMSGDTIWISYHDARRGDLRVMTVNVVDVLGSQNYSGLWWDSEESGWGINVSQQGDTIFATLFTYDAAGDPLWLVMSAGRRQGSATVYSGELYRTTGPAFNAAPFRPIGSSNITQVGTMTLGFAGEAGSLSYTVNGVTVNKTLRKQVFGARAASCSRQSFGRSTTSNYQDLWWNPAESGWGINLVQQGDVIFATLFTYDASGRAAWFVMSSGAKQGDGSFLGELFRTRGSAFNAVPFGPFVAEDVGEMRLRFADLEHGTLTYTINGATVVKSIERQLFSPEMTACFG